MMYDLLKEHADYLADKAVKFTSELVSTPSPSYFEKNVAELVEKKMKELGYDKVIVDNAGNVFGIIFGIDSEPTLLLNSHMDTVMPDESNQLSRQVGSLWEIPPYSGAIENGRLYGVGSADCKSGLAMQIYAGHLLKRSLLPLRGNLIVAATVSEENGLSIGVKHLISNTLAGMKMKVDYIVLGEPTNLGLFYGHDGWAEFRIGLDSPNPNFLHEAADTVFQNLYFQSQVKEIPDGIEMLNVNRPKYDDTHNAASIFMNRRLFANDNTEELLQRVKKDSFQNVKNESGLNIDIKIREEIQQLSNGKAMQVRYISSAWETDPFSQLMDRARQALVSAGVKSQPGKWRLPQLGMGTAGSVLTKKFNIPTIGYGPGKEENVHIPNEFVEIDNIRKGILGTASIIHNLIGVPVFGWPTDLDF
jgi:acetylornithine deacetylase/succinyl-diaminopimelate desuccinylase-like protein